jgi:hypothetical protein
MLINDKDFGRIEVETLKLPDFVKRLSATYTSSGKVLVDYKTNADPNVKDYINVAVVNDDGSGFHSIFSGVIPEHPHANGIRFMPYQDNTRVLLGDYVMECSPDIDDCESVSIIPVEYPWGIKEDARTFKHWSEIIIAPDNKHICWTALLGMFGGAVGIGVLTRESDRYVITDAQLIDFTGVFKEDPDHDGYLIPQPMRGGEIKQFVRGGTAVSLVGAKDSALPDSVVMDLLTGEMTQITKTPGYDETTMFSSDEKLGLVMSARGSENTSCAIIGLLPRPYCSLVTMAMSWPVYNYCVQGVRMFRKGNVGPVLIDIERSINEEGYQGVQLNDLDGNWVYCSPMSWHPSGKKVMWPEMLRGDKGIRRMRIAELHDIHPQEPVLAQQTPDDISFCTKDASKLWNLPENITEAKIEGNHSGYILHQRSAAGAKSEYHMYSDDGKNFTDGYEEAKRTAADETVFEANIVRTGEKPGEMNCRLTLHGLTSEDSAKLLLGLAADGKPKSYGYAVYNGKRLCVEDMPE